MAKGIVDFDDAPRPVGHRHNRMLVQRLQQGNVVALCRSKLQAAFGQLGHIVHKGVEALDGTILDVRQEMQEHVARRLGGGGRACLLKAAGLTR